MLQNIICLFLVLFAALYLFRQYIPKRKKNLPSSLNSPKSSACGCGSSCPLSKK